MQPPCVLDPGKSGKYAFIKWEVVGASAIVICNHEDLVLVLLRIKYWFDNCSHVICSRIVHVFIIVWPELQSPFGFNLTINLFTS